MPSKQLFTPDFGSSAFPMRSSSSTAPSIPSRKRVRFARQLTDEYEIANRKCRRGLSTSAEELRNRVRRLKRKIEQELETINFQNKLEVELIQQNDELVDRYAEIVVLISTKQQIEALKTRENRIEDAIFTLRMDTIRTKGLHEKLSKEKEVMILKGSSSFSSSCSAGMSLAQSLWSSARSLQPIPMFATSQAA